MDDKTTVRSAIDTQPAPWSKWAIASGISAVCAVLGFLIFPTIENPYISTVILFIEMLSALIGTVTGIVGMKKTRYSHLRGLWLSFASMVISLVLGSLLLLAILCSYGISTIH